MMKEQVKRPALEKYKDKKVEDLSQSEKDEILDEIIEDYITKE